jgi:antitoxin VapB
MTSTLVSAQLAFMVILSLETDALARRLADAQSVTVEHAIRQALEGQAHAAGIVLAELGRRRDQSPEAVAARRTRMDRMVRETAAMPILDPRPPCEIMDDLNAI